MYDVYILVHVKVEATKLDYKASYTNEAEHIV